MKVFNKELILCDTDQLDDYVYSENATVYAHNDRNILITVEHDTQDNDYCILVTKRSDAFNRVFVVSNSARYNDLNEAQQDLIEELDDQIRTLSQIRAAITS